MLNSGVAVAENLPRTLDNSLKKIANTGNSLTHTLCADRIGIARGVEKIRTIAEVKVEKRGQSPFLRGFDVACAKRFKKGL